MKSLQELILEVTEQKNCYFNNFKETELSLEEQVNNFNGAMQVYFTKFKGDKTFGIRFNGAKVITKQVPVKGINSIKKLGTLIKPMFNDIIKEKNGSDLAWLEINGIDCVGLVQHYGNVMLFPSKNIASQFNYLENGTITTVVQHASAMIAAALNLRTDDEIKQYFKNNVKVEL